jgi:tetratricopeptide (TPR) repeat protein
VLDVLKAAGRGLAAAHQVGVVHRDFKPDNVLVGKDGRVLVGDFGIARAEQGPVPSVSGARSPAPHAFSGGDPDDTETLPASPGAHTHSVPLPAPVESLVSIPTPTGELTQEGTILGTVGYIAPEHVFAGVDHPRSDQFGFCVTMYLTLYGRHPFVFDDLSSYVEALSRVPEPPPASTRVPRWIYAIIARGLRRDPEDRFASMDDLLAALEQDPSRRRRGWTAGALVAGACALGLIGWARHRADLHAQCARGAALMASAWNPAIEARTRDALERADGTSGRDLAERVARKLSEYASAWATAYRTIAEATLLRGEQSASTMDRRLQCLERGREQLHAFVDVLADADAAVAHRAVDVAYRLPVPAACTTSDVATLPALPAAPELRARALAADGAIAQAHLLLAAGQDGAAEAIVERLLPEVRAIPHPGTEAELLFLEGDCRQSRGDSRGALPKYREALWAAERAGDDSLAVKAASRAAFVLSGWLDRPEEGEHWIKLADAIADHRGRDDAIDVAVLDGSIVVTAMLGHPEQAIPLHDRLIAIDERLYGERDPRLAGAISDRGVTRNSLGQSRQAAEDFQRSIDILTSVAGPDNPHLALKFSNLSTALVMSDRAEEARAAALHALALQRNVKPGGVTIIIYSGIAAAEIELDHPDAAIEAATRGLEAADAIGDRGPNRWYNLLLRARARGAKGDYAGKIDDCKQGLVDRPESRPEALCCFGEVELARGNVDAAIRYLEPSAAIAHPDAPWDLPRAQFALARALRKAGRDPQRARELAQAARDGWRRMEGREKGIAEIERWLASEVDPR